MSDIYAIFELAVNKSVIESLGQKMSLVHRRCFISYHHAGQAWVDQLVNTFDHGRNLFIARGLGQTMAQDIIDSTDTDYVMHRIPEYWVR